MLRKILLAASLLTIASSISSCGTESLAQKVEKIRAKYNLPALGGAALVEGKVTKIVAVGTRKYGENAPVTDSDKWHLGSCGKAMTATLVAKFIERGELSWNTTMEEVFKSLDVHPGFRDVTVKMLLAHKGGLIGVEAGDIESADEGRLHKKLSGLDLDPVVGRQLVAETLLENEPSHDRKGKWVYSNAGYVIAGAVLETVSGKPWETLLAEEVFKPLEMNSCGFGSQASPDSAVPDQPWGHAESSTNPIPVKPGTPMSSVNPPTLGPAGLVHCSMRDWLRFLEAHIQGYHGRDTEILKAESFKKLHSGYGQQEYNAGGWIRSEADGELVLTHSGCDTMNYSMAIVVPKSKIAFIAVSNYGDCSIDRMKQLSLKGDAPTAQKALDEVIVLMATM